MSTPNPTHIDVIAKAAGKVLWDADGTLNFRLNADIAAHVVSKLTDAGYSIVQVCRYCSNPIEHTLGRWRHTGNGFGMLTCGSAYRDAGDNYRFAAPAAAEGEKP